MCRSQILLLPPAAKQRTGEQNPEHVHHRRRAGVTRGLIQASASGVIVAREILKREKTEGLNPWL